MHLIIYLIKILQYWYQESKGAFLYCPVPSNVAGWRCGGGGGLVVGHGVVFIPQLLNLY